MGGTFSVEIAGSIPHFFLELGHGFLPSFVRTEWMCVAVTEMGCLLFAAASPSAKPLCVRFESEVAMLLLAVS